MPTDDTKGPDDLPRLQLDELLEELQARISAARNARDRIHQLLQAVLSVGRDLDVTHVLRRITQAAVELVDCEYGALGVIGADGKLAQFEPVGVTEEQIRRIEAFPSGHGVLGELIRDPKPLRLRELSEHPASYGFPPHHPPMHSFLGVPVRVRGEVFGNLYLTQKQRADEFAPEDESLLQTLAVAAGVAIENARLYQETTDRQQWLEASAEVTRRLLSGADEHGVVELIAESARRILSADLVLLALPVKGRDDLKVALASGIDAETHRGLVLPRHGTFAGEAFTAAKPVTSLDIERDPRITAGPPRWKGLGPAVAVPMITGEAVRGAVMLARATGKPAFTDEETAPLAGFAGQAALAIELAEHRRDAEQIALLEDRDRIARDLHDLAIEKLFDMGMTLQSAVPLAQHPELRERLLRTVDEMDETIKTIRSTIYGLRAHQRRPGRSRLRERASKTVEKAAATLGFAPSLSVEGPLDTEVPPSLVEDVTAVLDEALSDIARHTHAHTADVRLTVDSGEVKLTVTDDGVGIPPGDRRDRSRHLAERAAELGGELIIDAPPGGGTRVTWHAPLPTR
ncbi:GAF domain-containing protein [Streptomyces sp. RB6PN25]|uniref:GAF domain-containing protein n=1 Tax=Streptomyces humicola TaxID=2953240 RepID=A0ABT1Q1R5_9ACTN|nr:GAF domain-containing protein [Streptomyces humicola]MCQ4083881.1 GAF domain-containing protein [Streptomyces humicola]